MPRFEFDVIFPHGVSPDTNGWNWPTEFTSTSGPDSLTVKFEFKQKGDRNDGTLMKIKNLQYKNTSYDIDMEHRKKIEYSWRGIPNEVNYTFGVPRGYIHHYDETAYAKKFILEINDKADMLTLHVFTQYTRNPPYIYTFPISISLIGGNKKTKRRRRNKKRHNKTAKRRRRV
jgi:hypothetical protein